MVQDIYRLTPNNMKMRKQCFETPEETSERIKRAADALIADTSIESARKFLSKLSMYDDNGDLIE